MFPDSQRFAYSDRVSDRRFVQLTEDLLSQFSVDGVLLFANDRWTSVLGWQPDELATISWFDWIHPSDRPAAIAAIQDLHDHAPNQPLPLTLDLRLQQRTGAYRWFRWTIAATAAELYAVAKDTTDSHQRLHLQQELQQQQQDFGLLQAAKIQLEWQVEEYKQAIKLTEQQLHHEQSDRQQVESALATSDQLIQNLAANLPGAIFQFSDHGKQWCMDYISEGIWEIMGAKPNDIIQDLKTFTNRIHPKDIRRYIASVADAIATRSPWHFEGRLIKPSGEERWWQGDATPMQTYSDGVSFCGVILDITRRKKAEQALQKANENLEIMVATRTQELQQIVDCLEHDKRERERVLQERKQVARQLQQSLQELADIQFALDQSTIVDIFDAKGVILTVNENFCKLSGYTRDELIGQTHHITASGTHSEEFFDELWRTIKSGKVWTGEIENRAKDGSSYWVETTIVPMLSPDSVPYQYISIRNNITERKQAEDRLRDREQFLRNIYEAVSHEIFVIDVIDEQAFRHAGLNPFAEEVTGYKAADVIGKTTQELFGVESGTAIEQRFRDCVRAGHSITYEEVLPFKGQVTWWLTTISPLKDADGKIKQLVGTAFEISDRIKAEQALRESKQLLQLVFDTLPQRVFWKDRDCRYLGCNKLFSEDAGLQSPDEIIGKTDFDLSWHDLAALYQAEDQKIMQNNLKKLNIEECKVHDDGKVSWIRNSMIPLYNAQQKVIGIFGCYEDITAEKQLELERRRADEQLRQSEQRFRDVSEAAGEYLWDFDMNGCYTFVTEKSLVVKGYKPEDLLGRSLFDFMPMEDAKMVRQILQTAIAHQQGFKLQHRDVTPTGDIVWEEVNGIPLLDDQGNIQGFRGAGLSITGRKQAEEALRASEAELRQQTHELEQALRDLQYTQTQLIQSEKMSSLGQLVAGVAHEINNPVNFIHGNILHAEQYSHDLLQLLQAYREFCPNPAPTLRHLEEDIDLEFLIDDLPKLLRSMKVGADRIREIVKSLRTFSRLDEAEFKTVDIHDGLESTLLILQNRLKSKSNSLGIQVTKYYGVVPPIECYAGQLNQVFMNILSNAIDALEEHFGLHQWQPINPPIQPTITITTEVYQQNWVRIAIADNGPGISASVQQRLFDPFFTTKQVGKGTGLGMSISYQIITERHRGTLTCLSTPGAGAEFLIQIPIHQTP